MDFVVSVYAFACWFYAQRLVQKDATQCFIPSVLTVRRPVRESSSMYVGRFPGGGGPQTPGGGPQKPGIPETSFVSRDVTNDVAPTVFCALLLVFRKSGVLYRATAGQSEEELHVSLPLRSRPRGHRLASRFVQSTS